MDFNAKTGGIMAFATQLEVDSYGYRVFANGVKQTNVFTEGMLIRVVPDTPIAAYIGNEKIFEDKPICSLSDAEVRDFIEIDLALTTTAGHLSIHPKFRHTAAVEEVTHVIFPRRSTRKSFLGIRLR
jgi:hypothetical protein